MSVLSTFLAGKGLSILASAVKVGLGYGKDGKEGAIAAAAQALGMPAKSTEEAIVEVAKTDPESAAKLLEVQNAIPLAQIEADKAELAALLFNEQQLASLGVQDRSNAREVFASTYDSPNSTHRFIIERTYYMLYSCIAAIGVLVVAVSWGDIPEMAVIIASNMLSMIIGALLKQMSSQSDFHFGSSIGSKSSDSKNAETTDFLKEIVSRLSLSKSEEKK